MLSIDDLLRDRELRQVVAHHLRLDLNRVEFLATVHTNHTANHLRDNNHITEVRLDSIWLLVRLGLLLGFAQLLDQTHGLALEAAVEPAAGAGVHDIAELFAGEVEEPAGQDNISVLLDAFLVGHGGYGVVRTHPDQYHGTRTS
jgi:hypothetical protein